MAEAQTVIIGVEVDHVVDLSKELDVIMDEAYDFIVVPLVHPSNERTLVQEDKTFVSQSLPFTRSDMVMSGSDWRQMVIGRVSTWIKPESPSLKIRENSSKILSQEINWASHLGLSACILPGPEDVCSNYAQMILSILGRLHGLQLWVQIPLIPTKVEHEIYEIKSSVEQKEKSEKQDLLISNLIAKHGSTSWERYNRFRLQCHHHHKLGVVLELTQNLPSEIEQDRWFGESLKAIFVPTSLFSTNSKGAPVLSQQHAKFLHKAFRHNIQVIIGGSPLHGSPPNRAIYQQYISHIFSKMPSLSNVDKFCQSYWDYLQDPLQPLMDNLESATYEVFERDPVKYKQYEDAVYHAMLDISKLKNSSNTEKKQLVVMVVGAGRGPIVEAAMRAEQRAGISVKLYALDKNPHALVTMRNKQLSGTMERWKSVIIVHQDMRDWQAPELADILVSEMLGSFGDNELSPECLQGAERLINPEFGVSIPKWYTSYLAPISTSKLWNELSLHHDHAKAFETNYVVKLHDFFEMAPCQPVFTFEHPSPPPFQNDRSITLNFKAATSALIHGFIGYFDCCLYKDIHISIEPSSYTTDMVSWFPIYFPVRHTMTVKAGDDIQVNFWRCSSGGKVWYEWSLTSPQNSIIYNTRGRSCAIGL